MKEATARIKINKLLEAAGWRFFADEKGPANIQLEPSVILKAGDLDALGQNFEKAKKGFIDFLLLNEKGFPFIVLEAKSEDKHPLVGKEQAREYAKSQKCRFVLLSNGSMHYFWDLVSGNPEIITTFPTPSSVAGRQKVVPMPKRLITEVVDDDYVVLTQRPGYKDDAGWKNEDERQRYIDLHGLRFLRPYQKKAIHKIQEKLDAGKTRFLLEMATGTGKTLTSAAIIKLFLKTLNAQRVLFLVDRLELEDQALKAFRKVLSNDFKAVIYKESRQEWRSAEIVVSTVQSLLFDNKYQRLFSPTDFDLVISDEAHRSIGGNARAVFDYFIGYKLGLTATPRDYLKNLDKEESQRKDPREHERRLMLDTYRTFGCEEGTPTYRYSLLNGVKDGFLINPTVVDCRTHVTTQLLSDAGFVVDAKDDESEDDGDKEIYRIRQFEKQFFSPATNQLFCKTFLENSLRDPVSGEMGKSIVFAVSQHHAAKLAQIFNAMADVIWPGKYQSDFAVQVTSHVTNAQQYTINFTNNNLLGSANFLPEYRTSKARICVTVGMMTTGYDCPDILNLGLFRPIFSPTDFIQIKGRGTRKHDFREQLLDEEMKGNIKTPQKTSFKLFDFFANCEYFEEKFDYDEVIKPPRPPGGGEGPDDGGTGTTGPTAGAGHEHMGEDLISTLKEETVGADGMKVDRMFFQNFEDKVKDDPDIAAGVEAGHWDVVTDYVHKHLLDEPASQFTLDKLRRAAGVDRRLSLREILEKNLRPHPRLQIQGRTSGGRVCQIPRRCQARRPRGHPRPQDLLQSLRQQRVRAPHHREARVCRVKHPSRLQHRRVQSRAEEVPRTHPRIHQRLRFLESIRGVSCPTAHASATASWSAVTEMQGASLHRRHRFRGVKDVLWPLHSVRPAKAAALPRGAECAMTLACHSACESGVAPRLAARTPRRSAFAWALGHLPREGVLEPERGAGHP